MEYNYTGKKVFVGIDVHKKKYVISCRCEGTPVKRWTMPASPEQLVEQLQKYFSGATLKTVYEAGFSGFVLHRRLQSQGVDNIIVNPASIETAAGDRVKTDKRDATKMAIQHESGRLRGIHIPSEAQELTRLLSRTRRSLTQERTRIGQKIKSKLYQFNLIPADDEHVLRKTQVMKWMNCSTVPEALQITLQSLGRTWLHLEGEVRALDKALAKQAQASPLENIYRSVPGIGLVGARILANELGDMSQFPNERTLFSFTGLTPSEHSSGESRRQGHISRCGKTGVRWILTEAAWVAIRKDAALKEAFDRIAQHAGVKRAIVAIARKLVGRIRACLRDGVLYEFNRIK